MPELIAGAGGAGVGAGAGAGTPDAGGASGALDSGGAGSGSSTPTKVSFSFDEGGEATEFELPGGEGGEEGSPAAAADFKFEQLDAIREGEHAELYKTLKAELSAKSRFAKHFKNPEELAGHMERLGRLAESMGSRNDGKVGLDAIEATVRDLSATLGKVQSGDGATVAQWFKDNPEGMTTFTSEAMKHLETTEPKLAAAIRAQHAVSFLQQKDASGFSALDAFNAMYQALPEGEAGAKLRSLLDRAAHSINELGNQASYKPDQTSFLDRQKKNNDATAARLWNKETDLAVEDVLRPSAGQVLSALLTKIAKDATPEERREWRAAMITDFYKEAGKDADFVSRLNALRKNGDRQGIVDLVKASRSKFLKEAAKNLYRSKLLNKAAIKKEASGQQDAASGSVNAPASKAVRYTGKVHPEKGPMVDFDYARMNQEGIEAMDRKFYIKGRKELFTW